METNPNVPRERHRRAERSAEPQVPAPQAPMRAAAPADMPTPTVRTPMPTGNAPRQPVPQPRTLRQQSAEPAWQQPTLHRDALRTSPPTRKPPAQSDAPEEKSDTPEKQKLPG